MKRTLLFIACVLASVTMLAQEGLTVSDVQNSGCLNETRGEDSQRVPTIVLTKEGCVLSVQLLNFEEDCCAEDFNVTSSISGGSDGGLCSVSINAFSVGEFNCDCYCPYNVSFTIHDLGPNSFFLNCWWYKGLVELTEGEPLVLEYKVENVTIDGISFKLLKVMHKAIVMDWTTTEKELLIPSEVNYESETYTVMGIDKDAFLNVSHATKVTVPKTVRSMDLDYDGAISANPFRECSALEWIEVEDGCPLFNSVDGVLFGKEWSMTILLGYPIASPRDTYTVPEGVTEIRSGAFHNNKYLRKLVIPEEVTYLGWHLFNDMKSLEELYIRGVISPYCMNDLFYGMDTKVAVYVQPSEVEKFLAVYNGPVYPLPELTSDNYYYYQGNKIPLTQNENKIVVSVLKADNEVSERILANIQILGSIKDETYDIYVITRSEYEKLTTLDFWTVDAKSAILTSSYFTENNEEVFATPYLNVRLKKEGDADLLASYAEQYKLTIVYNSPLMPLWYILAVTPESGKNSVECANELYESGNFASSVPDLADAIMPQPQLTYRPFVEEGKVWKVGALNSGNPVQVVKYYYFEGDTIINGMTCKKMMCQQYVDPDFAESNSISQDNSLSYVGAWYEEDQKVYFCDATNNQFKLMYDFSLDANATFEVDNLSYVIGPRQTGGIEGFKGVHRDVRRCESGENSYSPTWMEGVGSIDDPTKNVYYVDEAPSWCLMSCTVGDEVIYFNDEYEDGATPMVMESRRHRIDFTHTIKTRPRVPASPLPSLQGTKKTEKEESQLYGDYSNVQLGINLDPLDDAYLVCITNVTGKAVYEKTINAASIVGLDIDISAYAEGRYTVTVENSYEAFTGEIVLGDRTTGISIIPALFQEEGAIYNLQGQRISSLQKGLNIVNGQKVFVK